MSPRLLQLINFIISCLAAKLYEKISTLRPPFFFRKILDAAIRLSDFLSGSSVFSVALRVSF